ncbi:hypothetical protein GCM10020331_048800 [Ectobacillus funiculus]
MKKVADQFPNNQFAIVDSVIDKKRMSQALHLRKMKVLFLVGVVAALTTKSNKVGFIGGTKKVRSFKSLSMDLKRE